MGNAATVKVFGKFKEKFNKKKSVNTAVGQHVTIGNEVRFIATCLTFEGG